MNGCNNNPSSQDISPQQLQEQISSTSPPFVIDVRSGFEYRSNHIPGAAHMPFWSLPWSKSALPENSPLVLYCEHGPRAYLAGWILSLSSSQPIFYLQGHMQGWRKLGLPVEVAP